MSEERKKEKEAISRAHKKLSAAFQIKNSAETVEVDALSKS